MDRTPDEFCHLAGVAEGTVKGCMIVKQEASLEALLGGPQVADTISTWGLWYTLHSDDAVVTLYYHHRLLICNVQYR